MNSQNKLIILLSVIAVVVVILTIWMLGGFGALTPRSTVAPTVQPQEYVTLSVDALQK